MWAWSVRLREKLRFLKAFVSFFALYMPKRYISEASKSMTNLIVLGFDGLHTADDVLNKLRSLQKEYLIDLEDACVVEREADGKVYLKQAVNLTAVGAATGGSQGAIWGML